MKIMLALATFASAIIAAWYWFKSSRIKVESVATAEGASISDVLELHIMGAQTDIFTILHALRESSRLNKLAAVWTGVSAILTAVAAVTGPFL